MKSFNKKYISLKGLDKNISEQLENLSGKEINECCGCDCKCCEPTCVDSAFIYFHSEYEVRDRLKYNVKVQDLFNINRQFLNKQFMFGGATPADTLIPLYFKEPQMMIPQVPGSLVQASEQKGTEYNTKLYEFINKLLKDYKLTYPIVLTRADGSVQLFFVKGTGTNGKECSIKNSLIDVSELLEDLDEMEEITWSQVLDVSIDNIDDIYTFVITCTIDINKFNS
jgi:hypothetical protein